MPPKHWYIALVSNNTEKSSRDKLLSLGYEAYIPTQTEQRTWKDGTTHTIERPLLPTLLFIHTTDEERRHLANFPFIHHFLTNKSQPRSRVGIPNHPLATLTDTEMALLQTHLTAAPPPPSALQALTPTFLPAYLRHLTRRGA